MLFSKPRKGLINSASALVENTAQPTVASDSFSAMRNSVCVLKAVPRLTKAHDRERPPAALAELSPDSNTPKSTYPYGSLQPGCQTLLGKSDH